VFVSKPVRIPDPVFERVEREADRKDVSRGVIIRDWMDKADKYDDLDPRMK